MKRRHFIKAAATSSLLTSASLTTSTSLAGKTPSNDKVKWKMVTTWPKNFPGLGTGANNLAKLINEMSGGRLTIKVYGAKELVPAFEVFDAVSRGTAQMGHGASYYWKGKVQAAQFFAAVPFGLNAQEMNGWLYHGGGMALWRELYKPFGLVPAAAGNTGVQMAGWFNKQINSSADLKGLKMRIPGLGGEVLKRAGGTPVSLPGGEIFSSLKTGAIDASEWVGPYNDLAFGLHKAAKYYYYPGWHEPGTTLEALINQKTLEALPEDLQSIVLNACKIVNMDMISEYTTRNQQALETLVNKHKVKVLALPDEVLTTLQTLSDQVISEIAAQDKMAKKVFTSFKAYRDQVKKWTAISELAYLQHR
ncbi:TRAP transporter solute receptor, unknown substrate 6 [hydrothermal vent metagenome]|uniref:TRAP-type C4-dicarboxylate transport system, periplasmic component n=1 Tax=hydrothermal vent metagenome TaxID=652676 RepID=A0A3B0XT42_9ZZZZ